MLIGSVPFLQQLEERMDGHTPKNISQKWTKIAIRTKECATNAEVGAHKTPAA
jgi:hypothetical protein